MGAYIWYSIKEGTLLLRTSLFSNIWMVIKTVLYKIEKISEIKIFKSHWNKLILLMRLRL